MYIRTLLKTRRLPTQVTKARLHTIRPKGKGGEKEFARVWEVLRVWITDDTYSLQVKLTKELDGITCTLPAATRNMYVDGEFVLLLQMVSLPIDRLADPNNLQERSQHIIKRTCIFCCPCRIMPILLLCTTIQLANNPQLHILNPSLLLRIYGERKTDLRFFKWWVRKVRSC